MSVLYISNTELDLCFIALSFESDLEKDSGIDGIESGELNHHFR